MLAWAREQFDLARDIGGDKKSAHLESVMRQTGGRVVPPELLSPNQKPVRAEHVWSHFQELNNRRQYDGMNGLPHPISYSEIWAWSVLRRYRISQRELELIERLDAEFIKWQVNLKSKKVEEPKKELKRG